MKYILFVLGILCWIAFAYDIENDRDFMTWMWFITSQYLFVNSYIRYKHDIDRKSKEQLLKVEDIEEDIEEASIKEIPDTKTIEEASEKCFTKAHTCYKARRQGFIEGAKWHKKFIEEQYK